MAKKLSKSNSLADKFATTVMLNGKVRDVTDANYTGKAAAVAQKRIPPGHNICPIENPREWGAWLSYFKHIDKNVKYMRALGLTRMTDRSASRMWVPTLMPHEFDDDRLELTDTNAANAFVAAQEKARSEVADMGTPEQRLAQAQAAIKRVRDACSMPKKKKHTDNKVTTPAMRQRDPKRWRDPGELRASCDRLRELGMMEEAQEKDDA